MEEDFRLACDVLTGLKDVTPETLESLAKSYRLSVSADDTDNFYSLAYQWQDKKHRHVWDLTNMLEMCAVKIRLLEERTGATVSDV